MVADSDAFPEDRSKHSMVGHQKIAEVEVIKASTLQSVGVGLAGRGGNNIRDLIKNNIQIEVLTFNMRTVSYSCLTHFDMLLHPYSCKALEISFIVFGYCEVGDCIRIFTYSSSTGKFSEATSPGQLMPTSIGETGYAVKYIDSGEKRLSKIVEAFEVAHYDSRLDVFLPLSHGCTQNRYFKLVKRI